MGRIIPRLRPPGPRRSPTLRVLIIVALSAVSILTMVVFSLLIFQKIQDLVVDTAGTNTMQVVHQTATTVDSYINNMAQMSKVIANGVRSTYITSEEVQEFLDTSETLGTDIVSVSLFGDDGRVHFYTPSDQALKAGVRLENQQWYRQPASDGVFTFSAPHVQNLFHSRYIWVITLYTSIAVRGNDYIMAIDMNFESIDEFCSQVNIGKRGYVYLVDNGGGIIYHPQQQMVHAGIKEEDIAFITGREDGTYLYGDDVVVVISSLENVGWRAVGVSYLQDTQETTNDIVRNMIIAFVTVFAIILVFAAVMSRYISRPIGHIIRSMESAEQDRLLGDVQEDGYDEVRRLSTAYNHMTRRIRGLMDQIRREQRELRKTEIRALQAQINPHFLYNTLDSILWMCERGESEGAVEMVSALGTLFRISLNKGREIVSVREELTHAENYLKIQKIRYKDQFSYTVEAPEELLSLRVPKIIIQPFLENAIYHGFGQSAENGVIAIRVLHVEDKLLIEVEDNGVGMTEELVRDLVRGEVDSKSGIGVANVNNRIQIYFGREYGVSVHSAPDEGTCIKIWLPDEVSEDDILE